MFRRFLLLLAALLLAVPLSAASGKTSGKQAAKGDQKKDPYSAGTFAGLKLRSLGPAVCSGRIGDLAVDPTNPARYFVGVCSGGVWRTENDGTTFTPVFDDQGSYSIGCVTIDPHDPLTVWVGTGENNSQRSVSYGDGVYKSVDGGRHWRNMGLKDSEHIGMIAVDPRDGNTVYVAAQGPLWRSGGDRGLYKTVDGGQSWTRILEIDPDTGVSEIHIDPARPDELLAVAYQRRRRVWTLIDGGPGSAIYKSTDAGRTWRKLTRGLPKVDLGRIGLAVAPSRPDRVYAIVEAQDKKSGFYRSDDGGENWHEASDYITTSPQYYQELFVDPHDPDRVYAMDTRLHLSEDGGESWTTVGGKFKHVDNHACWIDTGDTRHLRVGCDGGLYETWDRGETWQFKANLPVTQFYKIAVDFAVPFYHVYGGTQDNNTLGAPVRTTNVHGIRNSDWTITRGGDGFEPQVDPTDPDIVYSQYQYGGLARFNRLTGEAVDIQPQPAWGDPAYRFNWNSPLLISPHDHRRLYYACQKLLRSDDMGGTWTEVSGDLSRGLDRNELKVMGRLWSVDAVAKNMSTSFYGSIVALDESPLQEGLIYVGTDDGLIQVTADGGRTWRKVEHFPGVPDRAYVQNVVASRHDPDVVFAVIDNHKRGDFTPYVLRSDDRGRHWTSIAGDLPPRGEAHDIAQDKVDPDLLFAGTEFGCYFTRDGGRHWLRLKGGLPTIAVRDLEIQPREDDLLLGTFGRGIYVLDDYSPLRSASPERLRDAAAILFPVRDALLYHQHTPLGGREKGAQGDAFFTAPNPPFGAVLTYYLKDKFETLREQRRDKEKQLRAQDKPIHYPSWDELRREDRDEKPLVAFEISDTTGHVVRRIKADNSAGIHRVAWDLTDPSLRPAGDELGQGGGPLVAPGVYRAVLVRVDDGRVTRLAGPVAFHVKPLAGAAVVADQRSRVLFQRRAAELQRAVLGAVKLTDELQDRLDRLRVAVFNTDEADTQAVARLRDFDTRLAAVRTELTGDATIARRSEPVPPSLVERVGRLTWTWDMTAAPTGTQQQSYRVVAEHFPPVLAGIKKIDADLTAFEQELEAMGAPWTPGRSPVWRAEK